MPGYSAKTESPTELARHRTAYSAPSPEHCETGRDSPEGTRPSHAVSAAWLRGGGSLVRRDFRVIHLEIRRPENTPERNIDGTPVHANEWRNPQDETVLPDPEISVRRIRPAFLDEDGIAGASPAPQNGRNDPGLLHFEKSFPCTVGRVDPHFHRNPSVSQV